LCKKGGVKEITNKLGGSRRIGGGRNLGLRFIKGEPQSRATHKRKKRIPNKKKKEREVPLKTAPRKKPKGSSE